MTIPKVKFSELYIKYNTVRTQRYLSIDSKTNEYKFDVSKIKDAHADCQERCRKWMESGYQIIVSNTFTQEWEMNPYYDMGKEFGYTIFSLIVENRHGGKNIHGVPDDKLEIMKNRFEVKLI